MASLRAVGDNFALVLSIYDGKDFVPTQSGQQLVVVGSLESKEVVEGEPIDFINETPDFHTELAWTMSRQTFQALRSRKSLLKVQIFNKSDMKLYGSHLFDLREAIPKLENDQNESYIVHATWRKLKCPETKPGRSCPEVRAALIIEPFEVDNNDEDKTMVDLDEDLQTEVADQISSKMCPILNNDKGYFELGAESNATNIFLFNVFVCFGRNVQLAFPKDVKVAETEYCHFAYDLFGTQISSKPFKWPKIEDFKPERATAKIFTSPENLIQYFNQGMDLFCFFVNVPNVNLALAEANLSQMIQIEDLDDLKAGKLFIYEKVLPLEPVKRNPNDPSLKLNVEANRSGSFVDHPSVGVRVSIGLRPDVGGEKVEPATSRSMTEASEVPLPEKIWAPIPTKLESTTSIKPSHTENHHTDTNGQETDASAISEHPDIIMQHQPIEVDVSDEPILRYKFSMDLKQIKLNWPLPVHCILKYKYKPFCATEVCTEPAFEIVPDAPESQEIRRGYCEYNFSAKESALQRPLDKHPLYVKVYNQDIHIGTATLKLNALFSSEASRTLDSRTCSVQVPILKKMNCLGSADIIGFLYCQFTLQELPISTVMETNAPPPQPPKSAFSPVKPRTSTDVDKIALELEEWKKKQKDRFKDQLHGLESHHIQTLSKEWEKREKERENVVHEKMNEILQIEKDLKKAIEDNRLKSKDLRSFEEELDQRGKKLDERENRLKTVLGKHSKTSIDKVQDRVKDLQKENEELKTEILKWKGKFEGLLTIKDEVVPLKKEATSLRTQNLELQKSKTSLTEKIHTLSKTNEFYKKAYEEAEQQAKKLQSEKDQSMNNALTGFREENVKLKQEIESIRNSYEKNLIKIVSKGPLLPDEGVGDHATESSSRTSTTVIDADKSKEIFRLNEQRKLFLNTRVYRESDHIIKIIDEKLKELRK